MDVELVELGAPRIVEGQAMRVVGLSGDYTREQTGEIPKQWERFNAELGRGQVAGQVGEWTYGVVFPIAVMRYVSGVEITGDAEVPAGWVEVTVPAQRYAVFSETGGVAMIRRVWVTIFSDWLPKSEMKVADGPMLERYPDDWFQSGDFEIWIPVG